MKQQLELHHIAKRLPYGVKGVERTGKIVNVGIHNSPPIINPKTVCITRFINEPNNYQLILHPLTNLTKEIVHNGERFVPIDRLSAFDWWVDAYNDWWDFQQPQYESMMHNAPYEVYEKLLDWHFDVDNLIEKGLAISVNDLKENPYE